MVTTILDKMLQPATDQMPPEFARKLLELRASDDLQSRIEELRGKAPLALCGRGATFQNSAIDWVAVQFQYCEAIPRSEFA